MRNSRFNWVHKYLFCLILFSFVDIQTSNGAEVHYLAIGDSVTFGIDPSTAASLTPSYGDQGYVSPFADFLSQRHFGVRPTINNLAIPGELSSSFFNGTSPNGWTSRIPGLNLNYDSATSSQHDLMLSTIQGINADGGDLRYVSLLMGSNDIFFLLTTAEFQSATFSEQQQLLTETISSVLIDYQTVLGELDVLAPDAVVLLPGYYNPYPDQTAEGQFYNSILGAFNPAVEQLASIFDAEYIDLDSIFDGRELELTNIGIGDVHPNQTGYALIANSFAQAVPEPASICFLTLLAMIVGFRTSIGSGRLLKLFRQVFVRMRFVIRV